MKPIGSLLEFWFWFGVVSVDILGIDNIYLNTHSDDKWDQ